MFPRALVTMAKEPRPGRVKTRLTTEISPEDAADLYRAFLMDLERETVAWDGGCDRWLAWADDDGQAPELHALFGRKFTMLPQEGSSLTDRMEHVFDTLFARGYRSVVMRNSDSPHLPMNILEAAFTAVEASPGSVVLGPDLDGGYYLVGMDAAHDGVFPRIMSTASVFDQTRAEAEARGLRVVTLPSYLDVDTPDDLAVLRLELLRSADHAHWATRLALESMP